MGEASDTDSGIMLHSGPNSPVSPLKERVQAGRRQQQALEARLDSCIQELRQLCLREAELTGTLPCEYPLKAGEKIPKVRRRIGAAFKLDEIIVLRGMDPLERERALQLQIAEASRRLCHEENIDRRVRKRRQTAALREEQKLRDLEQVLSQRRLLAGQRDTGTAEGGVGERSGGPRGRAGWWRGRGSALAPGGGPGSFLTGPCPTELSASDESSLSDTGLLEDEDTQPPGPAIPQSSPSPKNPTKEEDEGLGTLMVPPHSWRETSLDRPYERAKNPGIDPEDGETQSSQCYLGSLRAAPTSPMAPSSPDPTGSLVSRMRDPSYQFVPIQTLVLCRQAGSSAPSTPEPSGRRGQTQSLRVDPCWQPAEPRGRSTAPRRRPTYYTVTVPMSCLPAPGPACCSGSDDSNSDLSSISHATSPGSSSPDVSFAVPLPLAEPGYYPRGALQFLPPAGPATFLYEQDLAPLRYQRLVPSRSRIVRTPSLKDYAPAGARGLSKAAVTEELKSWHQRARLRGARPHSLDRQGAFRRPHGGTTRDMPVARGVLSLVQGPPVQVLRRSAAGVPMQVYVPESSEIVTQV
ncbi:innate immunity activator protein isoform X1 [Malurus melanocephalus]|uniref:innate immunity activator protein isoform X1 n=1 Tax=Malurus melanocephalus TaxID=175006 RepID=UPI002548F46E|nr:innate immunity activator protein isoform X1 [Malurus melanocephalus]XP_057230344.1 innate immunity activator protein isoform X1 [Malurus melanocephalus]XP_057230345.1 innate immunity activator protein isoform X1 [Malurus melanocephalus]XP_057230346.1 innate immunity activator protein isoform X1 [Malurus melanocephalus]